MPLSIRQGAIAVGALVLASGTLAFVQAQPGGPAPARADAFPPLDQAIAGLEKVVSTADGAASLWDLYVDRETGRMLAVLPPNYDKQLLMIACTVAGGDPEAGVMGPTHYVRWERYDKQLALVAPNFYVRSERSQAEAAASVDDLYTASVMLTTPIVAMAGNRPVIDLSSVLTTQVGRFFGPSIFGGYGASLQGVNPSLRKLVKAKAFPRNVVVEYQAPDPSGQIVRFAYSIGELAGTPGYKPRTANDKVGYFYDFHADFSEPASRDIYKRYINRWNVEKRDPSLTLSPPKQPIVWYIESTVPVRYRRYVREGILMWNDAFRAIGIDGAVEVRQQDAETGAFMDVDPEDARYAFFRWNTTDLGYAIGPSRTNPYTGEILDADVVWHQGLTRAVRGMRESLGADIAASAFDPETLAWLDAHPSWDPRVLLGGPSAPKASGPAQNAGCDHDACTDAHADQAGAHFASQRAAGRLMGGDCTIGEFLAVDLALADVAFESGVLDAGHGESLDGFPEDYIGQMIRYISAHEVGHCLGLQHNMIASSIRTLKEINTPGFSGATIGSVMDYAACNINHDLGEVQGPWATPVLGPYDHWAIAYGYGPEKDVDAVLKRSGEPDLVFQSQAAISQGSDPRNNTWELGADNLEFAESRLSLVRKVRENLLTTIVKDGQSWAEARRRYQSTVGSQLQMLSIASRWVGGSFIHNVAKGDPNSPAPITDIPGATQRRALNLIIANSFDDSASGLSPDLVRHLRKEHWYDGGGLNEAAAPEEFNVHNAVASIQGTGLTMLLNPGTLTRVYENEFRQAGQGDVLTLAEVISTVTDAAWKATAKPSGSNWSAAKPMVSSFQRNLQTEHLSRLETLTLLEGTSNPALRAIRQLAAGELARIDAWADAGLRLNPDPYTRAHLTEARARIARVREASIVQAR